MRVMPAINHHKMAAAHLGWRLVEIDPHLEWHYKRDGILIKVTYHPDGSVRRAVRVGPGIYQVREGRDRDKRETVALWIDADPANPGPRTF